MWRMVRFDDVYLTSFDVHGTPEWGPRDEAAKYKTGMAASQARDVCRYHEGKRNSIRVVRLVQRKRYECLRCATVFGSTRPEMFCIACGAALAAQVSRADQEEKT